MGTKGTLIMKGETESYYFPEETGTAAAKPTNLEVTPRTGNALVDASESRVADAAGGAQRTGQQPGAGEVRARALLPQRDQRLLRVHPHRRPADAWAPTKAIGSATACIRAYEAGDKKTRLTLDGQDSHVAKKPA